MGEASTCAANAAASAKDGESAAPGRPGWRPSQRQVVAFSVHLISFLGLVAAIWRTTTNGLLVAEIGLFDDEAVGHHLVMRRRSDDHLGRGLVGRVIECGQPLPRLDRHLSRKGKVPAVQDSAGSLQKFSGYLEARPAPRRAHSSARSRFPDYAPCCRRVYTVGSRE